MAQHARERPVAPAVAGPEESKGGGYMNTLIRALVLGASLSALGCSAGESDYEPSGTEANAKYETQFTVGEVRYAVAEAAAGEFVLLAQAPAAGPAPHEVLLNDYGQLTVLEIVLALAPEYEPSERMLDYHAFEARSMGRGDLSIRQVEYTAPAVEKVITPADCANHAASYLSNPITWWSNDFWAGSGGNGLIWHEPEPVTSPIALAICNPLSVSITRRLGWGIGWSNPTWPWGWGTTSSNGYQVIYGGWASQWRRYFIEWQGVGGSVYGGFSSGS